MILFKIVGLQFLEKNIFFQYILKYSSNTDLLFPRNPVEVRVQTKLKYENSYTSLFEKRIVFVSLF